MMVALLILLAYIIFVVVRAEFRKSGVRMIDAEWLEEVERFRLVSRWGVMG